MLKRTGSRVIFSLVSLSTPFSIGFKILRVWLRVCNPVGDDLVA
jgi:hypothetical protein